MEATLQGIFRWGYEDYKQRHGLSMDQRRAAEAIIACQTDSLGHEEWMCLDDGHIHRQAHSCRHRSCPRCHGAKTHEWLEKTQARLIACDHYHVIFTLPHELNALWQHNRQWCADHLFKASAETLQQLLADERYLGAEVGLMSALHTWGRTLSFHPHVHVLVSGGGLQGAAWRRGSKDYLLPVAVLKAKFRGKWLSWLNTAYAKGALQLPYGWTDATWRKTLAQIARKSWNIRIQGAYRHGRGVANYLSRYMRGGPIKDTQILSTNSKQVQFRYRDLRAEGHKTMILAREKFMARVLWHVPVRNQHGIRYYGFYTPGASGKRQRIRECLGMTAEESIERTHSAPPACPKCERPMFHRCSTRRENSYVRNRPTSVSADVQQGIALDRTESVAIPPWLASQPPPGFFCPSGGE